MASDAFVVGEDWISEHYFHTESTKQSFQARLATLRKSWDERQKDGEKTPASRLAAIRLGLLSALSNESTDAEAYDSAVLTPLVEALGYDDARRHRTVEGPVTILAPVDTPDSPAAAVVRARRVEDVSDLLAKDEETLLTPFTPEDADTVVSVARCLSYLFSGEDAPAFAVVLSGTWALLAERDRWAEGRYLAVDLQLALDRNDTKRAGEFDRAVAVLCSETVLPDVDGTTWWAETLEDSVKHTVGVSKDLREGVRESIEIIANEVVRRRHARSLDPLPDSEAQVLARQSLRFLYRILFLLYAEASPEMKVLPVGAPEYALGYGLDRLRELVLVELGEESRHHTHLYESLATLFRLVDAGHHGDRPAATDETLPEGLTFNPLNADLFAKQATSLIDEVGLGDGALQRVLQLLLLTRENQVKKGRDRGFISYADLGINQLGAVYEGLMSYTGFFAKEDLYEVAPDGDGSKGSWVVPVTRSDGIAETDFIRVTDPITGESKPRRYSNGEFVFRLSGRERQTSASFYTPEVLTKFVVSQALEELLDQDGKRTSAAEILQLSVCEPALGSGAFAIEAVRQLAEQYLDRREQEVGERIDPDERPRELQKVKAAIALHQVYGVDLNATAVELAEISLWLDTMVDGLKAPWFGLRLRRGNSLIGARRAVYSQQQVNDKSWLNDVPQDVPVSTLVDDIREGRVGGATSGKIHHFLLPADGWGSATEAKEGKELAPEAHAALREWRRKIRTKPRKKQLERLAALAHRVEVLWQFTLRRLEIAEAQVSRDIELWHDPREHSEQSAAVARAEIEAFLHDPNGAYQRLHRVMDAWCALWFWPLTDTLTHGVTPPTLDEWIDGLTAILGVHAEVKAPKRAAEGAQTLGLPTDWHDLDAAEAVELGFAQVESVQSAVAARPWLAVTERIANQNGFFHWELEFAGVFARDGFDLQVGNPPWVRPSFEPATSLAEYDVWFALTSKPSADDFGRHRASALDSLPARSAFIDDATSTTSTRSFLSSVQVFPRLANLRPDLYRCFMELSWRNTSPDGVDVLIHPETHFTDEKAGPLREATYGRLRRHWQFLNELKHLFPEIDNHVSFGVHVYGSPRSPRFKMATNLYHPSTVTGSLVHNGDGPEPGLRNASGGWELSPHSARVTEVDESILRTWHELVEDPQTPVRQTRMIYAVNRATAHVLSKVARSRTVAQTGVLFALGWDESANRKAGNIASEWTPTDSWEQVIVQGPHLYNGTPFYKNPNPTLASNKDWSTVDLEELRSTATPINAYRMIRPNELDRRFPRWTIKGSQVSSRHYYRLAWRSMAATNGERTLIAALLPPGAGYVTQSVYGLGHPDDTFVLAMLAGSFQSLIADLIVRSLPKSSIPASVVRRLPIAEDQYGTKIALRALRLNSLTEAYAPLWEGCFREEFATDSWAKQPLGFNQPLTTGKQWTKQTPLRLASARRQAQVEIDALMALALEVSIDELCAIYRAQFGVLHGYDTGRDMKKPYFFDANGRLVPKEVVKVWKQKGDAITLEERQAVHPGSGITYTYELPFVTLDREADMRQAYAHFEKILKERS